MEPKSNEQDAEDNAQSDDPKSARPDEDGPALNGNGKMVHTKSISIKDTLKGSTSTDQVTVSGQSEGPGDLANDQAEEKKLIPVSQETISKAWNEYAESIKESQPRVYNTLNHCQPLLDDLGIIRVELASNAQRDNFIQRIKPGIIDYFKQVMGDQEYEIESSLEQNGEVQKKVYTDEDKMKFLYKKNPLMEKFRKTFNLDFDD